MATLTIHLPDDKLKNTALFASVQVVAGSVEWANEIDLSYDTLYLEGV